MAVHPADEAFARYVLQTGMAKPEQVEVARRMAEIDGNLSLAEALLRQQVISADQHDAVARKLEGQGPVQQLGNFRILRKIGEGGMGAVYLAEEISNGRKVALKVLPKKNSADVDFMNRFRREAEAAIQLDHPNIVRGYSINEDKGFRFFVMEYCDGEPLDVRLKREKQLPLKDATGIVLQVARGLRYAHALGFIHRDIKPDNISLAPDGTARILDFGLTKNIDEAEQAFHTQTGFTMGTPHYIAPEQARGEKHLDGRVDIYSLGATYYHFVTGDTPFHGSSAIEIITQHLTRQLPDPRDLREEIPDGVSHIICRMMAKKAADRYRGCAELIADLEEVAAGRPPTTPALDAAKSVVALRSRRALKKQARPMTSEPRSSEGMIAWIALAAVATVIIVVLMMMAPSEPPDVPVKEPPAKRPTVAQADPPHPASGIPPTPPEVEKPKEVPKPEPTPDAIVEAKPARVETRIPESKPSEPAARPAPAEPLPAPLPAPAKPPEPAKEPVPAARVAMPPPAKLREAEDKIRKARKAEFDRRGRAERLLLAKALLQEGQIAGDDPVQSVALLRLSGEFSVEAGDYVGMFDAAQAIQGLVDARALDVVEKILERAAMTTKQSEVYAILAGGYEALSERLVAEDLYDSAVRIGEPMEKLARLSADLELVLQVQIRRRQLSELQKAFGPVKGARKTLETHPEDAGASLQVGRFLCFYKRDWEKGIPFLAKGSDVGFRAVAEQEQDKPAEPAAIAAVGDAWLGLMSKAGTLKPAVQERALFWYQKAWPQSQGKLRDRLRTAFKSALGRVSRPVKGGPGMPAGWNEGSAGQAGLSTQDDSFAKNGAFSARVSHALPGDKNVYVSFQTTHLPVVEGEEYILSGWILSDGTRPVANTDNLRASFFRTRDTQIGASLIELPTDQPYWTYFEKTAKAPPGATSVIVSVWISSPEGTVWADDISFRRVRDRKELIENGGMEKR